MSKRKGRVMEIVEDSNEIVMEIVEYSNEIAMEIVEYSNEKVMGRFRERILESTITGKR